MTVEITELDVDLEKDIPCCGLIPPDDHRCGRPAEFRICYKCPCGQHTQFMCKTCTDLVARGRGFCVRCRSIVEFKGLL